MKVSLPPLPPEGVVARDVAVCRRTQGVHAGDGIGTRGARPAADEEAAVREPDGVGDSRGVGRAIGDDDGGPRLGVSGPWGGEEDAGEGGAGEGEETRPT